MASAATANTDAKTEEEQRNAAQDSKYSIPDGHYVVHAVPVFDEHFNPAPNWPKNLRHVTRDLLRKIASRNNAAIRDTGDLTTVVIGHMESPEGNHDESSEAKSSNSPPLVGYARNFRVIDNYGKENPRACLVCDMIFREDQRDLLRKYPRRSVEIWPDDLRLDPISLLGAETPRRPLGLVKYSRESTPTQAKQANSTQADSRPTKSTQSINFSPEGTNTMATDANQTDELIDKLMATPQMAFLTRLMNEWDKEERTPEPETAPMAEQQPEQPDPIRNAAASNDQATMFDDEPEEPDDGYPEDDETPEVPPVRNAAAAYTPGGPEDNEDGDPLPVDEDDEDLQAAMKYMAKYMAKCGGKSQYGGKSRYEASAPAGSNTYVPGMAPSSSSDPSDFEKDRMKRDQIATKYARKEAENQALKRELEVFKAREREAKQKYARAECERMVTQLESEGYGYGNDSWNRSEMVERLLKRPESERDSELQFIRKHFRRAPINGFMPIARRTPAAVAATNGVTATASPTPDKIQQAAKYAKAHGVSFATAIRHVITESNEANGDE